MRQRLKGLAAADADYLRRAIALVESGERLLSGQLLYQLRLSAPEHREVQRWSGLHHARFAEWPQAAEQLRLALAQLPNDLPLRLKLAQVQERAGEPEAALHTLREALAREWSAEEWLTLSQELDRQGHYVEAKSCADRALLERPGHAVALLQRSRCTKALGDAVQAAADCRALIARGQLTPQAWFSLVDLKTVRLSDDELALLQRTAHAGTHAASDQVLLDFALGKALEDAGRPEEAFAVLGRANAAVRLQQPWSATQFAQHVAAVRDAFTPAPGGSGSGPGASTHATAGSGGDGAQGREVIFLVGLPRSGTTLVEQVLAAHSQVEGASELPYLDAVIDAESQRRNRPFPTWVGDATPDDWQRLGQQYLALSARWRKDKPISTDKLPGNWLLAGAALAMLPGTRLIDCRRDPVETCWSCYKQLFGPGLVGYTYGLDTLAAYWHEYDRLSRFWAEHSPGRVRMQQYEALVADPEGEIRALLEFCGLPFEAGCLQFHTAQRAIRTPSALQVRQPLRKTSTPAAQYGALLDPLRRLLNGD